MASCLRLVSTGSSRPSSILKNSRHWGKRSLHRRRDLPYPIEGGLGKFLPPPALQTLVEYQDGLLERLNHELRTDPKVEAHASVAQIAINYASKRERTLGFNYAMLALNNSFFLDQLSPPPDSPNRSTHEDKISSILDQSIQTHYGDLAHLKSTFSAAALGMFSNGWVWLVADQDGNLGVMPTLGPSTLLIRSRTNMHYEAEVGILGDDASLASGSPLPSLSGTWSASFGTPTSPASGASASQPPTPKNFNYLSRTMHSSSVVANDYSGVIGKYDTLADDRGGRGGSLFSVGHVLFPLFCLPVYEHAWMSAGFGIWGKEPWLKEFWTVLDWSKVSKAYAKHTTAQKSTY